jgi:hypothetical protein
MKRTCHRNERTCADGALSWKMMAWMTVAFAAVALTLPAADPGWWQQGAGGAIDFSTNNDSDVVHQDQARQFTVRAINELNANLTNDDGASPALSNLVYAWHIDYATNTGNGSGPNKSSDFQTVNVGQLKNIADLVYDQLSAAGYTGLYPSWILQGTNADNDAATIGELKQVFDFDFSLANPSHLTASSNTNGTINLSWTVPAKKQTASYLVEQQNVDNTWAVIAFLTNSAQTSYTVTDLAKGEEPSFQVIAQKGRNFSVPAVTPPDAGLTMPSNMEVRHGATNGELDLSWKNNPSDATYILVEESTDGVKWNIIARLDPTADSYAVTGLTVGQSYYFQLGAGNN